MPEEELTRVSIVVTGRVQGVFYRQSTRDVARRLGLRGYVKNEADGTVSIEAIGSKPDLERLIAWCHSGSPGSTVDQVMVYWLPFEELDSQTFEIIF